MASSRDFCAIVERALARFGALRLRAMFGCQGVYLDGLFCALIADERLYLKADEHTRAHFEQAGLEPCSPLKNKELVISYYAVPEAWLGERARLAPWVERALAAAERAKRRKSPKVSTKSARRSPIRLAPANWPGLGPVSRNWLQRVGVRERAELEARGALACFLAVEALGVRPTLNLLYALEALRQELPASALSQAERASLKTRLQRTRERHRAKQ